MRLLPLVLAAAVCVALFLMVLQREALLGWARGVTGDETAATTPAAPAPAQDTQDPLPIAQSQASEVQAVAVIALRSVARDVDDAVMVRGRTEAAREVTIASETTGRMISEPLGKGTFVEAGDRLCELDPGTRLASLAEAEARLAEARARIPEAQARVPQAQASLAEAEARLEEAKINQNAATRLSEDGFAAQTRVASADATLRAAEAGVTAARTGLETTRAGIESAVAGVQSAEASVENAKLEIAKLTIEAPFSGVLFTDTAELGELLQPGSPCATLQQLNPLKLVGFLPEADVNKVELGALAGARLATGDEVVGEVTFVSRSADMNTRTFETEITVPNDDLALRDGQTVEILIQADPIRAHLVPGSAMTLDDEGRLGLRVIEDGTAQFAPITLLRDTPEGMLISGLADEAEVIIVGQEYVTDGVPVAPTFRALNPAEATQ